MSSSGKNKDSTTLYAALYELFVSETGLGRQQKDHLVLERMHYVTEAASFLWAKSLLRKDGGNGEATQPLPLSCTKLLWGVVGVHKLPGYQKHGCVTVQLASCCKYCDNLGCQFDTPGKKEPQLRNCFHQIGSRAHLCVFLVAN